MRVSLVTKHHFAQSDTVDFLVGAEHGPANDGWDRVSREIITSITHLEVPGTVVANYARVVD